MVGKILSFLRFQMLVSSIFLAISQFFQAGHWHTVLLDNWGTILLRGMPFENFQEYGNLAKYNSKGRKSTRQKFDIFKKNDSEMAPNEGNSNP